MYEWKENLISDEKLNQRILDNREQIIIYGMGYNGCMLLQKLRENDITPIAVCDADKELCGTTISGCVVVPPEQLAAQPKSALVCITPENHIAQITRVMEELGFHYFLYSGSGAATLSIAKAFAEIPGEEKDRMASEDRDKMDFVRSHLKDEKSKAIFDAIIDFQFNGNYERLEGFYELNQYFADGLVQLEENEVFIDCGGNHAETAEEFINRVNNTHKAVYTLEPDEICYYAAKACIKRKKLRDVTLLALGLGRGKGEARFSSVGGGSSNINDQGDIVIQIDSIDNLLYDKERVTYIKMDIEGAEMDALLGATKTIARDKPKLAVCLYHKTGDFYELPYYLMNTYEGYDYYIRQHANNSETVLYAIPKGEGK